MARNHSLTCRSFGHSNCCWFGYRVGISHCRVAKIWNLCLLVNVSVRSVPKIRDLLGSKCVICNTKKLIQVFPKLRYFYSQLCGQHRNSTTNYYFTSCPALYYLLVQIYRYLVPCVVSLQYVCACLLVCFCV